MCVYITLTIPLRHFKVFLRLFFFIGLSVNKRKKKNKFCVLQSVSQDSIDLKFCHFVKKKKRRDVRDEKKVICMGHSFSISENDYLGLELKIQKMSFLFIA